VLGQDVVELFQLGREILFIAFPILKLRLDLIDQGVKLGFDIACRGGVQRIGEKEKNCRKRGREGLHG